MFRALIAEMKGSTGTCHMDVWKTTLCELFAVEYSKLPIRVEALPPHKKRFPHLKDAEATSLLRLFEQVFISSSGTFKEWQRIARSLGNGLLTTKWAFTELIRKLSSQHKWAKAPILNHWASVVRHGTSSTASTAASTTTEYKDFMFDPSRFPPDDIEHLTQLCADRSSAGRKVQLREGTDHEWKIIVGIAEGSVACRRMPDFLRAVLDSKERLRLYSTVQAQVEGHLVLHLAHTRGIPVGRQTTRAITESILESAEIAKVNLQEVHKLLGLTKTINYDRSTKSIHFFFFSRNAAMGLQDVRIPFQGRVYMLTNEHHPERGSVWNRQQGPSGRAGLLRAEYSIILHNLTRFNEIGRVAAYLKSKIPTEFDFEDLDTNCPTSRTSTSWKVTFRLSGCPLFLQGIVRILWFGTSIILRHPDVGRRLQCLQCGNLGHPASRCQFTDDQLRGVGGIEVTEGDLQAVEDLAKPFGSAAEIRIMADRRLHVQRSADAAAQAAVTPSGVSVSPPVVSDLPTVSPSVRSQSIYTPARPNSSDSVPAPKPPLERPWITKPVRGSNNPWTSRQPVRSPTQLSSGRFSVLSSTGRMDNPSTGSAPEPLATNLTDADGPERVHTTRPPLRLSTQEHTRRNQALSRGKAQTRSSPLLLTLKSQERATCLKLLSRMHDKQKHAISLPPRPIDVPTDLKALIPLLGLQEAITPVTGNCLAMAVAQALADAALDGPNDQLERLTAIIKNGVLYTGLLHLEEHYAHDLRVNALFKAQRGWASMTKRESANQYRWYLHDYAATPSARDSDIAETEWGGSDILGLAANFLSRDIYVLHEEAANMVGQVCHKYSPSVETRNNKAVETVREASLSLSTCVDAIIAAKLEPGTGRPLVLRLSGRHYSALLHSDRGAGLSDLSDSPLVHENLAGTSQLASDAPDGPQTSPDSVSPSGETGSQLCLYDSQLAMQSDVADVQSVGGASHALLLYGSPPAVADPPPPVETRKRAHASCADNQPTEDVSLRKKALAPPMSAVGHSYARGQLDFENLESRIDRDDWPGLWLSLIHEWPPSALTACPRVDSTTAEWVLTAQQDPIALLHHLRRFVFPCELLASLDVQVLVHLAARWRQDSLLSGLHSFRTKVASASLQDWLGCWIDRATSTAARSGLSPLLDNGDDWHKLRELKYAADDILKLCDPCRKVRYSQHLLCALLFEHEIGVLTEGVAVPSSPDLQIRRHLQLLKQNTAYKSAFYQDDRQYVDWRAVESFFYSALTPAAATALVCY